MLPALTHPRFGQQLRTALIKDYYYYYISYDELKTELKTRLRASPVWKESDERDFVRILEAELDKVFTFQKVKSGEIVRRIKVSQKEVEDVIKQLDSRPPAASGNGEGGSEAAKTGPTEEDFEMLEEDLSDIIADVHDLAKFTQLNYTGFQKIIKKHDVGSFVILGAGKGLMMGRNKRGGRYGLSFRQGSMQSRSLRTITMRLLSSCRGFMIWSGPGEIPPRATPRPVAASRTSSDRLPSTGCTPTISPS